MSQVMTIGRNCGGNLQEADMVACLGVELSFNRVAVAVTVAVVVGSRSRSLCIR